MLLDCMSVSDNCSYFFFISSSFQLTEKKNTQNLNTGSPMLVEKKGSVVAVNVC